jgi:phosphatidylserine decarboxylase
MSVRTEPNTWIFWQDPPLGWPTHNLASTLLSLLQHHEPFDIVHANFLRWTYKYDVHSQKHEFVLYGVANPKRVNRLLHQLVSPDRASIQHFPFSHATTLAKASFTGNPISIRTRPRVLAITSGTIVHVKTQGRWTYVRIYLAPKDPHTIYAPFDGTISRYETFQGEFRRLVFQSWETKTGRLLVTVQSNAFPNFSIQFWIEVGVKYITDTVKMLKRQGDAVNQGQEIGEIVMGSLAQMRLPKDATIQVQAHQFIHGGQTVIAE